MKIENLQTIGVPDSIDPLYKVEVTFSSSVYDIETFCGPSTMDEVATEMGKEILQTCKQIIEERNKPKTT